MQTKKMFFTAIAFLAFAFTANAQNATTPKPYVVQTLYVNPSMELHSLNLDSVLKVYKQNFIDPNNYVTSSKIVVHWWGHDSREVVLMYELKSLDDLDKAFDKQRDLQRDYVKDHQDYMKQLRTLFVESHHSDEIYRVVAE